MRTEVIHDATLYLGDCRDVLPTLGRVDAVVTDPPYGIGFGYASYQDTRDNLADLIRSVMGPLIETGARVCVTPGQTQVALYPPSDWICSIIWDTTGSFGHCGYSQWMPLLVYGKDVPCPKPENVMQAIISRFTDEGETILDPFMGSGTTGVACARLGRKFIGIEMEPRYFDIACRRIEAEYKQPRLFTEAAPKVKQEAFL